MIKAIIFDADGPLYHRSSSVTHSKAALLQSFGYESDYAAFEELFETKKFKAFDRSETVTQLFIDIMGKLDTKLSPQQAEDFTSQFNTLQANVVPSPGAQEILSRLHTHGYKVCVLTDSFYPASEKWPWFATLGMSQYIDEIVSSYDIAVLKSSKAAYDECLGRLGLAANEVVFVGHQQYEMDGAKLAGITSVVLTPIAIPKDAHGDYNLQSLDELSQLLSKLNV